MLDSNVCMSLKSNRIALDDNVIKRIRYIIQCVEAELKKFGIRHGDLFACHHRLESSRTQYATFWPYYWH